MPHASAHSCFKRRQFLHLVQNWQVDSRSRRQQSLPTFSCLYFKLQVILIKQALVDGFGSDLDGFSSLQMVLACFSSFQLVPHFSKYLLSTTKLIVSTKDIYVLSIIIINYHFKNCQIRIRMSQYMSRMYEHLQQKFLRCQITTQPH